MKKAAKFAFVKSIPIMLGYVFLGIAFGLVLQKAGLGPLWAFLISAGVYAGSMQFALVGILTGGLPFVTTDVYKRQRLNTSPPSKSTEAISSLSPELTAL